MIIYFICPILNLLKKPYMTKMTLSVPSSPSQVSFNSLEPQKLTCFFNPNLGDSHVEAKKLTIEDNKKVEVVPFTQHSISGNPKPKLSLAVDKPNPQLQPFNTHFHANYLITDNTPQDVDESCHLCDSTSITDSLDESSTLSAQDDHCFIWILPAPHFNYKTSLVMKLSFS